MVLAEDVSGRLRAARTQMVETRVTPSATRADDELETDIGHKDASPPFTLLPHKTQHSCTVARNSIEKKDGSSSQDRARRQSASTYPMSSRKCMRYHNRCRLRRRCTIVSQLLYSIWLLLFKRIAVLCIHLSVVLRATFIRRSSQRRIALSQPLSAFPCRGFRISCTDAIVLLVPNSSRAFMWQLIRKCSSSCLLCHFVLFAR